MANESEIFLGLVTHPHSTFNVNGRANEQCEQLRENLMSLGIDTRFVVSDRNDFTDQGISFALAERIHSAKVQAELEAEWNRYLGKPQSLISRYGMFLKRALAYAQDARSLERLANIDLSHLRLLAEGAESGAEWILIVEDDGLIKDARQASNIVKEIILNLNAHDSVFVNLSESIDAGSLGVEFHLQGATEILKFSQGHSLVQLDLPITNTVCANLYSIEFARRFRDAISEQGINPSIPIDWRLNKAILQASQGDSAGQASCYWVIPGIVTQGSMHGI